MWFFNKKTFKSDFKWLDVDIHSHILPNIDDGCETSEISATCITGLMELGFTQFIATPHIADGLYNNDALSIESAHANLMQFYASQNDQPKISCAAEYMVDAYFEELILTDKILCLQGDLVLIEMSYLFESPNIHKAIFDLQLKGYQPVLAHPERYVYYFNDAKKIQAFIDRGCQLQCNILSFSGYYGKEVRKQAMELAKGGLINFLGTDLHHNRHLDALRKMTEEVELLKILENCTIKNNQLTNILI